MSKFTAKVYPRLRRDYDSLVQQFSPGFAEAFERLDSPIGNDPQVQEIVRLQSELGESFWRAGIHIAGTLPKDERAQELDRIERKLKTTGWPYASFARPNTVADFEFNEYRREVKRLWQINQRLVSYCSSALKARPKKNRPVSRTAKLEWPDFQAMMNKSQAFDLPGLRELAGELPDLKVLLKLLRMQGDSLWNVALILTSHMERKSQEAELNKTEDQMRNLGWDDLRFKRPGFFFRPGKANLPKEMERFEKINLALHRLLGPLGRQDDFENEWADPQGQ